MDPVPPNTRHVLNAVPYGIMILHLENPQDTRSLRLLAANSASSTLTGVAMENFIGKTLWEAFPDLYQWDIPSRYAESALFDRSIDIGTFRYGDSNVALHDYDVKVRPLGERQICVCFEDISERKRVEDMLRERELLSRSILEATPDAMIMSNAEGIIESVNAQVESIFGYSRTELLGKPIEILVPESHRHAHVQHRGDFVKTPRVRPMGAGLDLKARRKDGSEFSVEISLSSTTFGNKMLVIAAVRDMTERRQIQTRLQASEERFRQLINSNIIGFMVINSEGILEDANAAALKILGYTAEEFPTARIHRDTIIPASHQVVADWICQRVRDEKKCPPVEMECVRKDGCHIPVMVGAIQLEGGDGRILYILVDISERRRAQDALRRSCDELEMRIKHRTATLQLEVKRRKKAEKALHAQAIRDSLTGLYNRRGFNEMFLRLLENARHQKKVLRLTLIDIDKMKVINDDFGHAEGDDALVQVAGLMRKAFSKTDIMARIGGDEFAVASLIEDSTEQSSIVRLRELIDARNRANEKPYSVNLSIGC